MRKGVKEIFLQNTAHQYLPESLKRRKQVKFSKLAKVSKGDNKNNLFVQNTSPFPRSESENTY